jgi:rhamnosyltransferase
MKIRFSVVIPTYNGEKIIPALLDKLIDLLSYYTREIIIIDSGSTDGTLKVIKNYHKKYPYFRIKKIKKSEFSHSGTRNLGVRMAKGEYVCFFSQDATPQDKKFFKYYLEDFKIDKRVVAVFGRNITRPGTPLFLKFEYDCRWDRVDRFVDNKGVLVERLDKPFTPFIPKNHLVWYFFSNTSSCYRRSFISKYPFPNVSYGEDMMIGRIIVENGLWKVYDKRCYVIHSHTFSLLEYYLKQKDDFELRLNKIDLPTQLNIFCKLKKLLALKINPIKKLFYLFAFIPYYIIKVIIWTEFKLKGSEKK